MNCQNVKADPAIILVVDDEPVLTKLVEEILSRKGHKVLVAAGGDEAIFVLGEVTPDLILMDINMPKMDGYETTSKIKLDSRMRDVPVIFLSGRPVEEDCGRSFAVGGVAFLRKPFKNNQLCDVVNLVLSTVPETTQDS